MEIKQTSQRGAVALITAMIVSILLMITTAGMVSLTTKSLRQSTDGAQSTKAYYAAEGGLEKALLRIRSGDLSDDCNIGKTSAESAKDGAVTCARISSNTNQLQGDLGADQTVQLDLSSVVGLKSINVQWSKNAALSSIPNYASAEGFRAKNDFVTPQPGDNIRRWSATAPAVLEVGLVEYPVSNFSINDVKFYQSILAPKSTVQGHASFGITPDANVTYPRDSEPEKRAYSAACVPTGEYQCAIKILGINSDSGIHANKKYVLRLKTRYNSTDYKITALGAGGAVLNIPSAMYTIDVTARAGDTFRRIKTSFPVGENPTALSGLDYVLYSDKDICKSFQVKNGQAQQLDSDPSCIPN